ncbi:MAG: ATP-dependent protease ATPase subunit HslU [Acidobacteria bacterium]|nr:ATP-dependent protease ATPase subunit HslU [Acidobacteriota bacterium]
MAITLPERFDNAPNADKLTPREIVDLLDDFIVGQAAAKRAVAIAIRNRHRRLALPADLVDEVAPKNILMIGPTGVGKTEISRRLSKLTGSPFLKVEATKFTEVGYVGRDVESMIRDLVDIATDLVRQEHATRVDAKAQSQAEELLLDVLLPQRPPRGETPEEREADNASQAATRDKLRSQLRAGKLDERTVEVEVDDNSSPSFQVFTGQGADTMDVSMKDMLPGMLGGGRKKRRRMSVPEALEHLGREAAATLIDEDEVRREAVDRAEASGIIFLDEIDKVAGRQGAQGPDVSREGVQRDILPIVEGTVVKTRSGMVRTDHILFLAAGAFHLSKPSDLIPELQGRFPLRVELDALTENDLFRILTEPANSLVRQYTALMATEGVTLTFTDGSLRAIAELAATVNERTENIGARRLHTMIEKVLEPLSFDAPERKGDKVEIDEEFVREALADLVADQDLSKYIL